MDKDLDKKARKLWSQYPLTSSKENKSQLNNFWKQYEKDIQEAKGINTEQVEQNRFVLIDIAQAYQELPQKHYVFYEKKEEPDFWPAKFAYNFVESIASMVTLAAIISIPIALIIYSTAGSASAMETFWVCSSIALCLFIIFNANRWFKGYISKVKPPLPKYKLPKKQYTLEFMPDYCTLNKTKIYYRAITQVNLIPVQNQLNIIENPITLPQKVFRLPLYDSENQLLADATINALYDFFQAVADYNKVKKTKKRAI